jgi:Outer membrane protein beta-barrel domain
VTRTPLLIAVVVFGSLFGWSQEPATRYEVGAQFTALDFKTLGEKPAGFGGRFGYTVNRYLAIETEANYFPQNPDGNFGQTQWVVGLRAGYDFRGLGLYAKLRPGFVRFGGEAYRAYNGNNPVRPAIDLGAVLQYFPHQGHVGVRFDWGDTLISMPAQVRPTGSATTVSGGLRHNFQGEIGVVVRF